MLATRKDVCSMINTMSDVDFSQFCILLNNYFEKSAKSFSEVR